MIINSEIVKQYFLDKSSENIKNHWIFNSIVEGEYLFSEPDFKEYNKLKKIYEILINSLNNFKPYNINIWEVLFKNFIFYDDIIIYLIVGSPNPYDAMVRNDKDGNNVIIIDLARISSYSNNFEEIVDIVSNFLTHEIAHILIRRKYKSPTLNNPLDEVLKFIAFDEGIAHFLSYKEDSLSIDWFDEIMISRKKKAYSEFLKVIENNVLDKEEVITKAISGKYWDKFGAISGMFAIIDYYYSQNQDINCFNNIFNNGPELLFKIIKR